MEGYGEAGDFGAPNGDLFIEVHVRQHPRFSRSGDNLESMIEVSPAQAAIGTKVDIETIDHRHVELKIPAGVQYNTALKIPGEGVKRRGKPGDLLVRVRIVIPRHLSPEERELYERILDLEGKKAPEGKKGFFSGLFTG
jgi:molecular chaperone DnaJ